MLATLVSLSAAAATLPSQPPPNALVAEAAPTFTFNQSATVGNPWVGLVQFAPRTSRKTVLADGTLSFAEVTEEGTSSRCKSCKPFPRSMENFYVSFASLMSGWHTFTLKAFDDLLSQIAARGNQAICRIYLDYPGKTKKPTDGVPAFLIDGLTFWTSVNGVTPDYANTTLIDAIVQLVEHLGDKYDGDTRLAAFQVGILGEWGGVTSRVPTLECPAWSPPWSSHLSPFERPCFRSRPRTQSGTRPTHTQSRRESGTSSSSRWRRSGTTSTRRPTSPWQSST